MVLVTIATVIYWLNPVGNPGVDMACMIVIGFLIYGPVMLIGLHALELAPKRRRAPRRALPACLVILAAPSRQARLSVIPWTISAGTAVF